MPLTGYADLPLHEGHVPPWLIKIMLKLSTSILKVMLIEFGPRKILERFSNPLWFQAFNNIIGMDWDSSGSTAVTTAIVKQALKDLNAELRVVGGKGKNSLKTPEEIVQVADELGLSSSIVENLKEISRLGAKVDNVLLQDGFRLYHHSLMITSKGEWVIIQQGMNPEAGFARRYHLAWFTTEDITLHPHTGIASDTRVKPLNLTSKNSEKSRSIIVDLMNEPTKKLVTEIARTNAYLKGQRTLFDYSKPIRPLIKIPYYRPIKLTKSLLKTLENLYEIKPLAVKEALLVPNAGPEVFRALALISELIYREPPSLDDPVTHPFNPFKYSYTIGGKDGVPYPVKKELAEAVIKELEEIISEAKINRREKLRALRSLAALAPEDKIVV